MDSGYGCITMFLLPLNCALKMAEKVNFMLPTFTTIEKNNESATHLTGR